MKKGGPYYLTTHDKNYTRHATNATARDDDDEPYPAACCHLAPAINSLHELLNHKQCLELELTIRVVIIQEAQLLQSFLIFKSQK
jgi:hypothetical protein